MEQVMLRNYGFDFLQEGHKNFITGKKRFVELFSHLLLRTKVRTVLIVEGWIFQFSGKSNSHFSVIIVSSSSSQILNRNFDAFTVSFIQVKNRFDPCFWIMLVRRKQTCWPFWFIFMFNLLFLFNYRPKYSVKVSTEHYIFMEEN